MKGHDFVWHLAANTDIIGGFDKPRRDLEDCAIGTFNVLNSMNENRTKPMIFSSTGATYGDLCKDEPKENLLDRFYLYQTTQLVRLPVKLLFLHFVACMTLEHGFIGLGMLSVQE